MTVRATMVARVEKAFPRGAGDFALQLFVWMAFLGVYQVARGVAVSSGWEAFSNGRSVIALERELHAFVEADVQRVFVHMGSWLVDIFNWTYWNSQFTVVGVALLWVYFRRYEAFPRLRNTLIVANLIALIGFVLIPTAPPRLFPEWGFVDTLASASWLNHGSSMVELAGNPFAAMPSIHSADALILGFAMAAIVRSRLARVLWTLWPTWVWLTVMVTGNHFWLDVLAGIGVALVATSLVLGAESARRRLVTSSRIVAP